MIATVENYCKNLLWNKFWKTPINEQFPREI